MTVEERDALIEELRGVLYDGTTSPRIVLKAARNIMDRIPQRYHIKLTGEQYTSE